MTRDDFAQKLFDAWAISRFDAKYTQPLENVSPGLRAAWHRVAETALATAGLVKSGSHAMYCQVTPNPGAARS